MLLGPPQIPNSEAKARNSKDQELPLWLLSIGGYWSPSQDASPSLTCSLDGYEYERKMNQ